MAVNKANPQTPEERAAQIAANQRSPVYQNAVDKLNYGTPMTLSLVDGKLMSADPLDDTPWLNRQLQERVSSNLGWALRPQLDTRPFEVYDWANQPRQDRMRDDGTYGSTPLLSDTEKVAFQQQQQAKLINTFRAQNSFADAYTEIANDIWNNANGGEGTPSYAELAAIDPTQIMGILNDPTSANYLSEGTLGHINNFQPYDDADVRDWVSTGWINPTVAADPMRRGLISSALDPNWSTFNNYLVPQYGQASGNMDNFFADDRSAQSAANTRNQTAYDAYTMQGDYAGGLMPEGGYKGYSLDTPYEGTNPFRYGMATPTQAREDSSMEIPGQQSWQRFWSGSGPGWNGGSSTQPATLNWGGPFNIKNPWSMG